jgi:hypothetical protein
MVREEILMALAEAQNQMKLQYCAWGDALAVGMLLEGPRRT